MGLNKNYNKHKNRYAVLCGNDGCGLNKCYSVKCNKQQEKFCVSRAKIFTSGNTESNPAGPVDACVLLQSRLISPTGLANLRCWGCR